MKENIVSGMGSTRGLKQTCGLGVSMFQKVGGREVWFDLWSDFLVLSNLHVMVGFDENLGLLPGICFHQQLLLITAVRGRFAAKIDEPLKERENMTRKKG